MADYSQVNSHDNDNDDNDSPINTSNSHYAPHSPPPSFRSHASSPTGRRLLEEDPLGNDAERDLEDTFGDGSDDEEDDRQRLMRGNPDNGQIIRTPSSSSDAESRPAVERRVTELPAFRPPTRALEQPANDGVFANLGAKLERGEQVDEKPPVSNIHHKCSPNTY